MRNRKGQTLIEVLVALGVAVILAVSLITTSLITQKAARQAKNNSQATKLAQEYVEQIRIYRDRKGFAALNSSASGVTDGTCARLVTADANPDNWSLASSSCPELTSLGGTIAFNRSLVITSPAAGKKLVTVTVSWTDSGGTQTITNQTFLTDWRGFQ